MICVILAAAALTIGCVSVPQETTTLRTASTQAAPSTTLTTPETSTTTAASSSSSTSTSSSTTTTPAAYVNLKAAEFKKLVDDNNTFVVDVRTPEDVHIKGTDAVIPYDRIKENQNKLPADKNTVIAVYCTSGRRGEIAARDLAALGYLHIYNLEGGAIAWQKAGYEME
jgi:rhodanese-related sulfurtransferase